MTNPTTGSRTVRRSVALPGQLLQRARTAAPAELRDNVNRLVVVALQEYVSRRQREEFIGLMADMAQDPAIQVECRSIAQAFQTADGDGLPDGSGSRARARGKSR